MVKLGVNIHHIHHVNINFYDNGCYYMANIYIIYIYIHYMDNRVTLVKLFFSG